MIGSADVTIASQPIAAHARPFGRRFIVLLGLAALPVGLTSAILAIPGVAPAIRAVLRPPYHAFTLYAVANWVTIALVVAVAGRPWLRAHGLRFRVTAAHAAGAVMGLVTGLGVFSVISAALAATGLPPVRGMTFDGASALEIAVLFFSAVITAPFCEEVLFRVVWFAGLRSRLGAVVAAAVSIVAFAFIHYPYFGLGGVIFISFWSILPTVLFARFGDLTAPLTMHVLNNIFAYILVPFVLSAP